MNRREFIRAGLLLGLSKTSLLNHSALTALQANKSLNMLSSARTVFDLVDIARKQAEISTNSKWARMLFRAAIILASDSQEYEYTGDAISRSLNDYDWGKEVMQIAIEKSACSEDLISIAYTLAKHDGFSNFNWAVEVFTSSVGKVQSIAELIDVAYTMCWADEFMPHVKTMFLEMTPKANLPDHLAGMPEKIIKYDFDSAGWAGKALRELAPNYIPQNPLLNRDKILSFLLKINLV